jgi:hypothetical protein
MMLIEGMKKLRLIEKRMTGNASDIERYASMVSTEMPIFESLEAQKRKVTQLVQANGDLMHEYLTVKNAIDKTNIETQVTLEQGTYTIAELLIIKRKLANLMATTFKALNENTGQSRLRHAPNTPENPAHLVRLYDEEFKMRGLREWQDLYHVIDSRLEVVNATTPLLGFEE